MTLLVGVETGPAKSASPLAKAIYGCLLECTTAGTVEEIHCKSSASGWTSVTGVWLAIYADNEYEAGKHRPGVLLGKAKFNETPVAGATFAATGLSVAVTKGTKYWLDILAVGGTPKLLSTTAGTSTVRRSTKSAYTEPAESTEWEAETAEGPLSLWATGTTGTAASGSTVVRGGGMVTLIASKTAERAPVVHGGGSTVAAGKQAATGTPTVSGGGRCVTVATRAQAAVGEVRGGGTVASVGEVLEGPQSLLVGVASGPSKAISPTFKTIYAEMVEAPERGTLQQLHCLSSSATWTAVTGVWLGVYADSEYEAGKHRPGALLAAAQYVGTPVPSKAFKAVLNSPLHLTAKTNYWLALVSVGGSAKFLATSGGTATVRRSVKQTYTTLQESTEWNEPVSEGPLSLWGSGILGAEASTVVHGGGSVLTSGVKAEALGVGQIHGGGRPTTTAEAAGRGKGAVQGGGRLTTASERRSTGATSVSGGGTVASVGVGPVSLNVPYVEGGGVQQQMDIYPSEVANSPLVVFIHGGGWVERDKNEFVKESEELRAHNSSVFTINYRLTGKGGTLPNAWPAESEDVEKAILYAIAHAATYNANPTNVILVAGSAGANLAAIAALNLNAAKAGTVRACSLLSGAYDMRKLCEEVEVGGATGMKRYVLPAMGVAKTTELPENTAYANEWSPAKHVTSSNDPARWQLFTGNSEELMPINQTAVLKTAITAAGGRYISREVAASEHAFTYWKKVSAEVFAFIRETEAEAQVHGGGSIQTSTARITGGSTSISGGGRSSVVAGREIQRAPQVHGGGTTATAGNRSASTTTVASGGGAITATIATARTAPAVVHGGGRVTSVFSTQSAHIHGGGRIRLVGERDAVPVYMTITSQPGVAMQITNGARGSMNWHAGDAWTVRVVLTDPETNTKVDPDIVQVTITTPAGVKETAAMLRDSEGEYRHVTSLTEPGQWEARINTTGKYQGSSPKRIRVRP